jgi:hypothetical protein
MRLHHVLLAAVVASVLVTGCKSKQTPASIDQTRASFARLAPESQVGVVSAVLPERGLLAVGEVDVAKYNVGDTFVLLTPEKKIIGAGHVVAKTNDSLHLSYDVNEGGRAPRVGDIAVKPTM